MRLERRKTSCDTSMASSAVFTSITTTTRVFVHCQDLVLLVRSGTTARAHSGRVSESVLACRTTRGVDTWATAAFTRSIQSELVALGLSMIETRKLRQKMQRIRLVESDISVAQYFRKRKPDGAIEGPMVVRANRFAWPVR